MDKNTETKGNAGGTGKVERLVRRIDKRWNRRWRYDMLRIKIAQRANNWMYFANFMSEEDGRKTLAINYHASARLRILGERWGYLTRFEKERIKRDRAKHPSST